MNLPTLLRHAELSAEGLADIGQRGACDREPIHLSGAIQPHGFLVAVDAATLRIQAASANAPGAGSPGLLGAPLASVFAPEILRAVSAGQSVGTPYGLLPDRVRLPAGQGGTAAYDLIVHRRGAFVLLEFEAATSGRDSADAEFFQRQYAASKALHEVDSVDDLCAVTVREIRRLSDYDRVMVYRFDPDAHGSIVAEARHATAKPFLGLHYPASDIPRQARQLYLRNWIRVIPDCAYTQVPLLAAPGAAAVDQLDLSMSVLRSISPFHVQYLHNMGVRATMTVSLIIDNQLWGLIACHHDTPKYIPHMRRLAFEALGQQVSVRLRAAEIAAVQARAQRLGRLSAQVVTAMAAAETAVRGAEETQEALLGMVGAQGAVLEIEGNRAIFGEVPDGPRLDDLLGHLGERAGAGPAPWCTDSLPGLPDASDAPGGSATGAMYLPLPGHAQNFILWLRGERASTVRWAGEVDPTKEESPDPLQPRASFTEWKQLVRGRSAPWRAEEIATATEFAQAMPEVLMHRAQNRLVRLALHDPLTGLPNRLHLTDRLERLLNPTRPDREPEASLVGVLFIDLDGFKAVNDTLGHEVGDELLQHVARRITGLIRGQDIAGRMGGDEFVIVIPGITLREASAVAARIVDSFRRPFLLNGQRRRFVTMSIGVTAVPRGASPAEALRQADSAMYHAKRSGRDQVATYDPDTRSAVNCQHLAIDELRHAIASGQIIPFFQPVFDIQGDGPPVLHGYEALARWQHPDRGLVPPNVFIELAEEADLIGELGESMLRQSLQQLRLWQSRHLTLAVNVSVRQLVGPGFAEGVLGTLLELGLEPGQLRLEVTESQIMEEPDLVLSALNQLNAAGVQIAIDDFGTGHSSLAYVRNLPAAVLKIDRTFVMGLPHNGRDAAVVRATIELAHALGMQTVAEGVETPEQLDHLRRAGADQVQGFLLGRPADAATTAAGHAPAAAAGLPLDRSGPAAAMLH